MSHPEIKMEHESGQKTLSSYIIGFILSFFLTVAAFYLVANRVLPDTASLYVALALLAIAQLLVQSMCFLRLNASKEGRWNLLPFLFSILIIAILVGGTLWIMYNLNMNMTT